MQTLRKLRLALLLSTVVPANAFAQATPASSDATAEGGDEIIVTAQKIEQRLTDVPLTVTAITGSTIRRLGASSLGELSAYVPGLNVQEQSANATGYVIRGITSDDGSAQSAGRVTIYYNGVDISRGPGSYQDAYDLERVEVVKGPQATLFGTASTIGAISMISEKPKAGYAGSLTGGYGNYNFFQTEGFINAGNDTLAGRIAFAFKKRDGFVRNISGDANVPNQNTARVAQDDLNGQNQLGVRGRLRWKPNDKLTADLILTYDRQHNPGTAFKSGSFAPTGGNTSPYSYAELGGAPDSLATLGAAKLGLRRDVYDANLTISYELSDDITMTTVNGYRNFKSAEVYDGDGSQAWWLEFAAGAKGWQASHETRFAYSGEKVRAFFGFNFFTEDTSSSTRFSTEEGTYLQCAANLIPGLGCIAPSGVVAASQATSILTGGAATTLPYASIYSEGGRNYSYSLFADATWIPVPKLELTAGIRAQIEKRISSYSSVQPNSVIAGAPLIGVVSTNGATFERQGNEQAFLPRFNALYRVSDRVNLYATIAKGRHSPVVNLAAANGPTGPVPAVQNVPEEIVWNYEAGVKVSARGFTGSLAGFYQKYEGFQVIVSENGRAVTRNAGSAGSWGIEADGRAQISSAFSLFANAAYIDAQIDNEPANGVFAGSRFRLQSKWQGAAGLTVTLPVTQDWTFTATPSVTYRSKLYFEVPNNEVTSQGPVTLINLTAGFSNERFSISAYAKNLLNENYLVDAGNTGGFFGFPTFIRAQPRLYGAQVGVKF